MVRTRSRRAAISLPRMLASGPDRLMSAAAVAGPHVDRPAPSPAAVKNATIHDRKPWSSQQWAPYPITNRLLARWRITALGSRNSRPSSGRLRTGPLGLPGATHVLTTAEAPSGPRQATAKVHRQPRLSARTPASAYDALIPTP
jgi:hypothetical protein